MQGEQDPGVQCQTVKGNRPHCFYLWYIHGKAVCSEEFLDRSCAYPFWNCPARCKISDDVHEELMNKSAPEFAQEKTYNELSSA